MHQIESLAWETDLDAINIGGCDQTSHGGDLLPSRRLVCRGMMDGRWKIAVKIRAAELAATWCRGQWKDRNCCGVLGVEEAEN